MCWWDVVRSGTVCVPAFSFSLQLQPSAVAAAVIAGKCSGLVEGDAGSQVLLAQLLVYEVERSACLRTAAFRYALRSPISSRFSRVLFARHKISSKLSTLPQKEFCGLEWPLK